MERQKIRFASGDTECAAWHYPGSNGGCVVMTGGFAVTKEPGTDLFARRFNEAGFSVLAFDYRHLGESGGQPRQVQRIREQLADWRAAIGCAKALPGVDPARVAIWSFSSSAGHVFRVAARAPGLAAAIAQTPYADGLAASRSAARYQKPAAMLRFAGLGIADAVGALAGRPPRLVPLSGDPGAVALLTTPDGRDGGRAGCGARCWSWSATRTSPCWPDPPSARPAGRRGPSWSGCPAGTTSRSSAATSGPSRPNCPSCAGTCSASRRPAGRPRPRSPRGGRHE